MTQIAIVYHSGYGHTARQAEAVARGVRSSPGAVAHLIRAEDVEQHWSTLAAADGIIFGAPTYMGSLSAGFTNSASQNGDKLASLQQLAIFAAQHGMIWVGLGLLPGNNSSKASPEDLNRLGSFLGAMAQSNADQGPEHGPTPADLRTAEHLGRRVAEAAARWRLGEPASAAA